MTREEAIKILDLNAGRLSNSVQMAIATLIRETSLPSDSDVDKAAREYAIPSYMKDVDKEHLDEYPYNKADEIAFKAGAEWQRKQQNEKMKANTLGELIEYLSKRFDVSYAKLARIVVKTASWQKEQMLKAAVGGRVLELGETYKDLSLSVESKELNEVLQPLGVKDGDRVRMIIIKEDSK